MWWDCVATLAYLAAVTHRVRLVGRGYALALRHPLAAAKQWATLDALSRRSGHPRGRRRARRRRARRARHRPRPARRPAGRGARRGAGGARRRVLVARRRRLGLRGDGRRPPARAGAPARVGGRLVRGRAAPRRRRGPTAGCRRGRPRAACPPGSPTSAACSTRRGGRTEPFTVGARSGALYVGEPRWDVGRAVHGSPEQVAGFLRVLAGLGVDQIEVAFRSRDVHELYDQIRLFGAEVAPLVR